MRKHAKGLLIGLAGLGVAALAVWAQDKSEQKKPEEKIVSSQEALLAELPAKATAALMNVSQYSRIDSIETVTQGDARLFIATWTRDGLAHDASITEDGAVVETNEQVEPGLVPPTVQRTGVEFFPSGAQLEYGRKTLVMYTVRGPLKGHGHEILVTPTGVLADDGRTAAEEEEHVHSETQPATQPAHVRAATTLPAGGKR